MITINYQTFGNKGFQLRLRLYQAGETKFINVTKLLKGAIQKKHWNQKKQLFIPSCPYSAENNAMLVEFRQKYDNMAINWKGTVFGMITAMEMETQTTQETYSVSGFIEHVVRQLNERKHPDGTVKGTFESYQKCDRRLREFCKAKHISYDKLLISDVTPAFIDKVFDWIRTSRKNKGKGYMVLSLSFVMYASISYLNYCSRPATHISCYDYVFSFVCIPHGLYPCD